MININILYQKTIAFCDYISIESIFQLQRDTQGETMKILVLIAHPDLRHSRVNRYWEQYLRQHPDITVHNLYAAYPNGIIDHVREREMLFNHDRIVFQFPLYWFSAPALLKKWQDEVLASLWSETEGKQLSGKDLILAISTGAPQSSYGPDGFNHFTLEELMRPYQAMANMNGLNFLPMFSFYHALQATDTEIFLSAQEYVKHITNPHLKPLHPRSTVTASAD
jgi:glutathione-regulated potassium-efflux system ancillary protein KefG